MPARFRLNSNIVFEFCKDLPLFQCPLKTL
nr:MAG TPA: hypothetical protein [Caudoviricetes sp.]